MGVGAKPSVRDKVMGSTLDRLNFRWPETASESQPVRPGYDSCARDSYSETQPLAVTFA